MAWFNRNKKPEGDTEAAHDKRVEVVVHQEATKKAVEDAKAASRHLNDLLLDEDEITIRIYLATGGKPRRRTS